MIKKLRVKFVLTAALAVFITLAVLVTAMNTVNYAKTAKYADDLLDVLYANDGRFDNFLKDEAVSDGAAVPPRDGGDNSSVSGDDSGGDNVGGAAKDKSAPPEIPHKGMSAETPYETRFFTVKKANGALVADVKNVASVSETEAIDLYDKVVGGKERGYVSKYRYLSANGGDFVLFVDCTRGLNSAATFLRTSLIVSAAGFMAVILLLILFSNKAVKPVKESYERQKRFITDASHELKTPLTIISANNELTALISGESEQTKTIEKQVERMTATVKDMTELAKLDEEEKTRFAAFSLDEAVGDLCGAFEAALCARGRAFEKNIADGVYVYADEAAFRRAVSTVLDNAQKYALTKTAVTLETNKKYAVLTVENDAAGIRTGDLSKCFERFYRSEEARASGLSGSGIGLSIAKAIVVRCGGEISARGEDTGENGIFKIEIKIKKCK